MKKTENLKSILVSAEIHQQLKMFVAKNGTMMKTYVEKVLVDALKKDDN